MHKVILVSVLVALVTIPLVRSREKNPRLALRHTIRDVVIFNVIYVLLLRFVYLRS